MVKELGVQQSQPEMSRGLGANACSPAAPRQPLVVGVLVLCPRARVATELPEFVLPGLLGSPQYRWNKRAQVTDAREVVRETTRLSLCHL